MHIAYIIHVGHFGTTTIMVESNSVVEELLL